MSRAPVKPWLKADASSVGSSGVEKMPLPAKAMKVPMSLMMSWRPAFKTVDTSPLRPPTLLRVEVVELTVEGHIAAATLELCWRAVLKMTTGGAPESSVNPLAVLELDSDCGHLSGCCLR